MNGDISKETWQQLDSNDREWIMFDSLQSTHKRIKKLEDRKWLNTGVQFVGSLFGGLVMVLVYIKIFAPMVEAACRTGGGP